MPYIIHSDQGRQYESQLFLEMCKVLHIKKTRTTPYHPQSDGMVERFNKTLVRMLKSYINNHQSDWDEHLPFLTMAYRSAEHETTGFSPNYLMLGREVSTPLDIMYEMPSSIRSIPENQWAWALKEKLEEAYRCVRNHVPGAMLRAKWKLGPFKIPKIGHPNIARPQVKRPRTAHIEIPSTSQEESPAAVVENKNSLEESEQAGIKISAGTQTDAVKCRKVVWKTTSYQEGGRQIEIVEMEETEFMDSSD